VSKKKLISCIASKLFIFSVFQSNEFEVTKKEYRRARENLFANMVKQGKFEEVLPFFIEICKCGLKEMKSSGRECKSTRRDSST
jgi:hypothetical protein